MTLNSYSQITGEIQVFVKFVLRLFHTFKYSGPKLYEAPPDSSTPAAPGSNFPTPGTVDRPLLK